MCASYDGHAPHGLSSQDGRGRSDGEDGGDDLKTYVGSAPPADTGTCLGDLMGWWLVGEGVWREVCARPFGTERKEPQEGWATGR